MLDQLWYIFMCSHGFMMPLNYEERNVHTTNPHYSMHVVPFTEIDLKNKKFLRCVFKVCAGNSNVTFNEFLKRSWKLIQFEFVWNISLPFFRKRYCKQWFLGFHYNVSASKPVFATLWNQVGQQWTHFYIVQQKMKSSFDQLFPGWLGAVKFLQHARRFAGHRRKTGARSTPCVRQIGRPREIVEKPRSNFKFEANCDKRTECAPSLSVQMPAIFANAPRFEGRHILKPRLCAFCFRSCL